MNINSILKLSNEFNSKIISYSNSFLFGALGALFVFIVAYYFTSMPPSIGTVNITRIVDQFIKEEAVKNLPPNILKQEVKLFGKNLEKELKQFSSQNHLVLLPSEAVIAGSHDYTSLIMQRITDQRRNAL